MVIRVYLLPFLGLKRLDTISNEDVQRLKGWMNTKAVKTVNNVLTVLSVLLTKAVEWGVIGHTPCTVRLLSVPKFSASFHGFEEFERLVDAAKSGDAEAQLIVLLGGVATGTDSAGIEQKA